MGTMKPLKAQGGQAGCPFLQPANADWIYPVAGYCRGLPRGLLMIPTVEEHRTRCATEGHTECPIYRYQLGEDRLEQWLLTHYRACNPACGAGAPEIPPAGIGAPQPSEYAP
jgi:hypothetical protein